MSAHLDPHAAFLESLAASGERSTTSTGDPLECSALDAVRALRAGDWRAEDYAQALLASAAAQPGLNAFRQLRPEAVMAAARAADQQRAQGLPCGPLHGLPIPVKDSVDSADLPTSNGTPALRDFQPAEDAVLLRRLREAGALLMGKTNLHELSYGWTSSNPTFGPVRNPWNPDRVAGGSSGGSAAAVAARMAPLAVAEDTQGSIRVPASMCGIAGLRPSFGRYPGGGLMSLTLDRFDQAGPLARCVADLALFDAVLTRDWSPLRAKPMAQVRLGVCRRRLLAGLDPEVQRAVDQALVALAHAGVTLVEVDFDAIIPEAVELAMRIISRETAPAMAAYLERAGAGIGFEDVLAQAGAEVRATLLAVAVGAGRPDAASHREALSRLAALGREVSRIYRAARIDALAYPPCLCPAPPVGEEDEVELGERRLPLWIAMARNTSLGSCAGLASLVLPVGRTSAGLPVGLEFAALPGEDRALLEFGLSAEAVLGRLPAPPRA